MTILETIQSLINKANQVTGKEDADLTSAVLSLIDGYSKNTTSDVNNEESN